MGLSAGETRDLLRGRSTITIAIARRLAGSLGGSVEFWMSRDYQYRENSSRVEEVERTWLRQLLLGDMVKFGWLSPCPLPSDEAGRLSAFFCSEEYFRVAKQLRKSAGNGGFQVIPCFRLET